VPAIGVPVMSFFFVQETFSIDLYSGMISLCRAILSSGLKPLSGMTAFTVTKSFCGMMLFSRMVPLNAGVFITAAALLAAGRRKMAEGTLAVG